MTGQTQEDMDATQQEREHATDDLLEEQEHKGYGEDEGEREESLSDE